VFTVWIDLAQDEDNLLVLVKTVIDSQAHYKVENDFCCEH
jgi:hypothetical protein